MGVGQSYGTRRPSPRARPVNPPTAVTTNGVRDFSLVWSSAFRRPLKSGTPTVLIHFESYGTLGDKGDPMSGNEPTIENGKRRGGSEPPLSRVKAPLVTNVVVATIAAA